MVIDINRLRKASKAVYLATEKSVADELSQMLSNAADELETEKEHSVFLEQLLKALYGSGWEYLTVSKANEIRKSLGGPE